ncbi:LuxR C-terminal-related transcriptional regulator [Stigmatella sp. ncwal1]|uniref:LuxR C-terminal-related transcriptional regulator n=1 Tax=Stigmatella ashevillensis TaxID=2995309 RepID=A0ABT5D3U3_9BACT|nr:helix-turn-helix transcriptional regulator [Stigmatella ashevillena]MDC0708342.1 LuxR C-terminal-related transcriptional regulator [Stigmatella ashevillena]
MGLIKGSLLIDTQQFVNERFGPEVWRMQVAELPASERAAVLRPVSACWYELSAFRSLLQALCGHVGGQSGFVMEELGRFTAVRELSGTQRWLFHLGRPCFAVKNLNLCWRRMFDVGQWTSQHENGALALKLVGWEGEPHFCDWNTGYIRCALEFLGWQVNHFEHTAGPTCGETACAFNAVVQLKAGAVRVRKITSQGELLHMARALAQCAQAEELARLIVELIRIQLDCADAQLWISEDEGEEMRLLCTAGEWRRGSQRSCLLLETRGRMVGRIEVRHVQAQLDQAAAHLLDELLPFMASSLANALGSRTPEPGTPRNDSEAFGQRLLAARHLWALTARQADVLTLAVQGKTNKEIAQELGCQKSTVELHMSHILRKCGADNRSMLTSSFWSLR